MLANATVYLDSFGHVVVAWMWLQQALVAYKGIAADGGELDFYQGKMAACKFFYKYELPQVYVSFDLVSSLDDTCMNMKIEQLLF